MMDIYKTFGPGSLSVAQYKLSRGEVLTKAELAQIIRANPGVALPAAIADHMAQWFEGKVKGRRGRKPAGAGALIRNFLALIYYERYLSWLQARQRRAALTNHPTVHWWQGPPHERAARMAARRLGCNQSWRHIQNLVSRQH
jgi:hypothetical protein